MADRKISELTNITGANLADGDELVVVDASASETKAITFGEFKNALDTATGFVSITGDTMTGDLTVPNIIVSGNVDGRDLSVDGAKLDNINQGVATTDSPTFAGLTTTANVSFGDNDKAIFGAGSDLQIYHDGSRSIIQDNGTGNLRIQANNLELNNADNSENYLFAANNGAVTLYYDNAEKLATTSTGIDVTGTVTADGLTVDDAGTLQFTKNTVAFGDSLGVVEFHDEDGTASADAGKFQLQAYRGGDKDAPDFKLIGSDSTGVLRDRLQVEGNGDISFYEDTGTTAKFFWDASAESLGIGTTSPSAKLHSNVGAASTTGVLAENANDAASTGDLIKAYSARGNTSAYNLFKAENSTGVKFLVSGSGNVGIGTSSPTQKLTIEGAAGYLATVQENSANKVRLQTYVDATQAALVSGYNTTAKPMTFFTGGSEAMRIDSSGNLLVGTTNSTPHNLTSGGGLSVRGSINLFSIARQDNEVMIVNRTGTDGDIALFRKNASTVGSIGTDGALNIGSTNTGIKFGTSAVWATTGGSTNSNGAKDLGASTVRWKDLYLSGGVYLGGTGSANHLDDYEEGTWDPTFLAVSGSFGSITYDAFTKGAYTRIGRVVYITGTIRTDAITVGTASTGVRVSGLPFTVAANDPVTSRNMLSPLALSDHNNFASDSPNRAEFSTSATSFVLQKQSSITSNTALLLPSDLGTGTNANRLAFSGFYFTDA